MNTEFDTTQHLRAATRDSEALATPFLRINSTARRRKGNRAILSVMYRAVAMTILGSLVSLSALANVSGAIPLQPGVQHWDELNDAHEVDIYTFDVMHEGGAKVLLWTLGYNGNGDTAIVLLRDQEHPTYDAEPYLLEYDDDSGVNSYSKLEYSCDTVPLPQGRYYVWVYHSDVGESGFNAVGQYSMNFLLYEDCPVEPEITEDLPRVDFYRHGSLDDPYNEFFHRALLRSQEAGSIDYQPRSLDRWQDSNLESKPDVVIAPSYLESWFSEVYPDSVVISQEQIWELPHDTIFSEIPGANSPFPWMPDGSLPKFDDLPDFGPDGNGLNPGFDTALDNILGPDGMDGPPDGEMSGRVGVFGWDDVAIIIWVIIVQKAAESHIDSEMKKVDNSGDVSPNDANDEKVDPDPKDAGVPGGPKDTVDGGGRDFLIALNKFAEDMANDELLNEILAGRVAPENADEAREFAHWLAANQVPNAEQILAGQPPEADDAGITMVLYWIWSNTMFAGQEENLEIAYWWKNGAPIDPVEASVATAVVGHVDLLNNELQLSFAK